MTTTTTTTLTRVAAGEYRHGELSIRAQATTALGRQGSRTTRWLVSTPDHRVLGTYPTLARARAALPYLTRKNQT